MRTLLKYLLISSVLLGLAIGAFVVRINGRTVYAHMSQLSTGSFESVVAQIKAELAEESAEKPKKRAERPAPKPGDKAVFHLEKAAKKTSKLPKETLAKKQTRTDRETSASEEAALDRLLEKRLK